MDDTFEKARRNLIVTSFFLNLYYLAGGKIEKFTGLGGAVVMERPWVAVVAAWCVFFWFAWRYWLQGKDEHRRFTAQLHRRINATREFMDLVRQHVTLTPVNRPLTSEALSFVQHQYGACRGVKKSGYLILDPSEHHARLKYSDDTIAEIEGEQILIPYDAYRNILWRQAVEYALKEKVFSDFVFAPLFAMLTFFVGLSFELYRWLS